MRMHHSEYETHFIQCSLHPLQNADVGCDSKTASNTLSRFVDVTKLLLVPQHICN